MNPNPTIPHSREAEEATLGAILINPDIFHTMYFLNHMDFYIHRNRFVWEAITRLSEKRVAIDLLTVSEEMDKTGQLKEVGGPAYLTSLLTNVPDSLNAEHYGRIVLEHAVRRRLLNAANEIARAAYNVELGVEQVTEVANKELTDAIQHDKNEGENLADALSKVYDRTYENADRREKGQPIEVGLTTGFMDLDKILLGIEDEEFVLVAARPGKGKTSFLLNIAVHNALKKNKKVAIFSMEMSNEEIARRMISSYAEIDSQKIKTGSMDEREWPLFTNAIEALENSGIYISDASSLTPAKLRARCLQRKRTHGLDLVIVDYIGLMNPGVKMENRTNDVGYISRQLKILNKELKCPIIAASQLSRKVEDRANKRPVLSDLRDSGDLEQDANTVIFLHKEDEVSNDKQNLVNVIIAKRRDGAVGEASLVYRPTFTKFADASLRTFTPNVKKTDEARAIYAISSAVGSED